MNVFLELSKRKFYLELQGEESSNLPKNLTLTKKGAKVTIKKTENNYQCSFLRKKFNLNNKEFHTFIDYLTSLKNIEEETKQLTLLNKDISKTLGAKKFKKNQKESLNSIVQSFMTSNDEKHVSKKLTKNVTLSQYSSILFLILKKGSSSANIFDYSSGKLKTEKISATKFNTIFSAIKKSKKNYFFQHEVISNDLNLVGNILGDAFEIENTNIVFLLSRGDFLPPTQKESQDFINTSEELKRNFSSTQNRLDISKYIECSMEILKLLNIDTSIKYLNKTIYSNSNSSKLFENFKTELPHLDFFYNFKDQSNLDKGDFFQHQRILLLGELFNILKHELSNPIFGINMALNVLKELFNAGELQDLFNETVNASERSLRIFETMTDLFSGDSVKKRTIIASDILNNLKLTLKSELRHIHYTNEFDSETTPHVEIFTDPSIVNQVLFNLVRNSIQDLKEKKVNNPFIKLNLEVRHKKLIIRITDNGSGIPEEYLQKIFQPKTSYKKSGSGLGLSISKNLAEKINAQLNLISTSKLGTTFQFVLPIK